MQQFQVPQYIEVKDKIFGPLTVKQLIYLLGGGGLVLMLYLLKLPTIIFLILGIPIGSFFVALAMLKINEQELDQVLNNAVNHFWNPRLYIWKKEEMDIKNTQKKVLQGLPSAPIPKLSQRKLQDLAWSLDINSKFKR
ncbi:MAG: PrgI family protein [Patescibacteria group bacterium]